MNEENWLALMERLNLASNMATFAQLQSHYEQPHRHYHNTHHITATLNCLEKVRAYTRNYDALEMALWFHDAVYDVFSSSNEQDSADWAVRFLQQNQVDSPFIETVYRLIMATLHEVTPVGSDEALMVDIDLSILGRESQDYAQFEQAIRKEYQRIPSFIYKRKRRAILQGFLNRACIFSHEYFVERYEKQARNNLTWAINAL